MAIQQEHEKFMHRCLDLAMKGMGCVSPNPMVGAVVVHGDRAIGEGFHRSYGGAHAEPLAIASVEDESLLKESTLYVSLEPCSHFGKTPPCAQLIIDKKIPRVFVGCLDPSPEVSGRGIRMLAEAGVDVRVGLLQAECEALNRRFLTFHRLKRPYIFLKWAQSADGFMDRTRTPGDGLPAVTFSGPRSQMLVHRMRARESAILVGTGTAMLDNPLLTVRRWPGKNPLRIAIDRDLKIPAGSHLLDATAETLVFTSADMRDTSSVRYCRLDFSSDILPQMMSVLHEMRILSLIVEGGSHLLHTMIAAGLWDEILVETISLRLGHGLKSPSLPLLPDEMHACGQSIHYRYIKKFIS
jgi:diaminohydroxyphosphoribosylaminopyrimidine deaminase/5-amino-6-(5-phosphoribosylamino)uracil reductase